MNSFKWIIYLRVKSLDSSTQFWHALFKRTIFMCVQQRYLKYIDEVSFMRNMNSVTWIIYLSTKNINAEKLFAEIKYTFLD